MKAFKLIAFVLGLLAAMPAQSQSTTDTSGNGLYRKVYQHLRHKDFFSARNLYSSHQDKLQAYQQLVLQAHIDNAFNQNQESDRCIARALQNHRAQVHDSVMIDLYGLQHDNAYKQYDYAGAKKALQKILDNYSKNITAKDKDDYRNSLKLWRALSGQPRQEIKVPGDVSIQMTKDIAGLHNLKVDNGKDSAHFIFDTGANISTTIQSVAKKFKMKMLSGTVEVGTITGKTVNAGLALCSYLNMGGIELRNVVFLVFDDKDLAFPQANFQVYGIIGFPVIEALGEVQITREGQFIVPQQQSSPLHTIPMALDNLTPIIALDGKHYTFDTGADKTMLYKNYFDLYKSNIEAAFEQTKIYYGGAGGSLSYTGYRVPFGTKINTKNVLLEQTDVLSEKVKNKTIYVYGNIGQDFIRQFDKMTLNFNRMFLKFD